MSSLVDAKIIVVVPNWNGAAVLASCLKSLQKQTQPHEIVVVENGSKDQSQVILDTQFPQVTVLKQFKNLGFAGGVNVGISYAIEQGCDYVALLNNDAVAEQAWLASLLAAMTEPKTGITTSKMLSANGKTIDSTGEYYTAWGLPYSRGRGETVGRQHDNETNLFAASGGASLYRISMLREIGLFDEDFFAYYEDVDLSFRAQLTGWKIRYAPEAIVRHRIGETSSKFKGFTTYQTMKNQPLVVFKNVPRKFLWRITWRFIIAHTLFFLRACTRGQGWIAFKGDADGTKLLFKNFGTRRKIQKNRKVSDDYIWSIITHDLPPNAFALRKLRARIWKLRGKRAV